MAETHQGGCLCGAIRYSVSGKPVRSTNCHCSECRKAAGSPFVTWAEFPAGAVDFIQGKPALYRSSDKAERGFCPDCGTALTFSYIDGDTMDLTVATFDDPEAFSPDDHIWTSERISWLRMDDGLPRLPRGHIDG